MLDFGSTISAAVFNYYGALEGYAFEPGLWELRTGTTPIPAEMDRLAVFQLTLSSPFYEDGVPQVSVPEVVIWVEDGYRIVDITVDWYQFDPYLERYEPVSPEIVQAHVTRIHVNLTDPNDTDYGDARVDDVYNPLEETYSSLGVEWYVGDYDGEAERVHVDYWILNTTFEFHLCR